MTPGPVVDRSAAEPEHWTVTVYQQFHFWKRPQAYLRLLRRGESLLRALLQIFCDAANVGNTYNVAAPEPKY